MQRVAETDGRRWRRCARAFAAVLLIFVGAPVHALQVVVESVGVESDPEVEVESFFDVYVVIEPGDTALPNLNSWQGAVDLVGASGGVTFHAPWAMLPMAPHAPLISNSFLPDFGSDNDANRASATAFLMSGGVSIADGGGLLRVPFTVAPGVEGAFEVAIDEDEFTGVFLVAEDLSEIPYTAVAGTITVVPPVAVPMLTMPWTIAYAGALGWIGLRRIFRVGPFGRDRRVVRL